MKIKDYKYDLKNFQKNAIDALKARDDASEKLTKIEKSRKRNQLPSMDYYNAYLEYMATDNAHMKTYLDYIKYYHDAMTYYSKEKNSVACETLANKLEGCFDIYYELYEKLIKSENALRQSIKDSEVRVSNLSEMQRVYLLHSCLMNSDRVHFQVHSEVEMIRESMIAPILEKCDMLIPEDDFRSEAGEEPKA